MADDKRALAHNLILEGRSSLSVSGVREIDSFDEQSVVLLTDQGELTIRGEGLHINKIDVESGELSLTGEIFLLEYSDTFTPRGNFWQKLFR